MSEQLPPGEQQKHGEARQTSWFGKIRGKVFDVLFFLLILGSFFHEHETDLNGLSAANQRFGAAVHRYSTFNFNDEIYSRIKSCDYEFLVICTPHYRPCLSRIELPNSEPICMQYAAENDAGDGGWLSYVLHIPEAVVYMLVQRWQRGPLEFSIAVLFTLGVLAAVVTAARTNPLYIPGALIGAPILISVVFWIIQQLLSVMSAGLGYVLALGASIAGILATRHYLTFAHDMHSLSEAAVRMFKDKEPDRKP